MLRLVLMVSRKIVVWRGRSMNGPLFIPAKVDVQGTWGGLPWSYLEQEESVGFPLIPSFIQAGELRKC